MSEQFYTEKNPLTLDHLKALKQGIFATGDLINSPDGIYITDEIEWLGKPLKWVAVRGQIHDWAIYVGTNDHSDRYIAEMGNKIQDNTNISKLVICTQEALDMYRH